MELDFQGIVDILYDILPKDWEKAVFMAEYTSGSYSMRCYSDNKDGCFQDVSKDSTVSKIQVVKSFKRIHSLLSKQREDMGEKKWYAMTLHFERQGKFKAEFDHKNHEENVLQYIEEWKHRNLN